MKENKNKINEVLKANGLYARVNEPISSPQLNRFKIDLKEKFEPTRKFIRLEKDLQVYLNNKFVSVDIEGGIFINVPNKEVKPIKTPIMEYNNFEGKFHLGVDLNCKDIELDFIKHPHILMVGETGAGKTVALRNLIIQMKKQNWSINIIDTKIVGFQDLKSKNTFIAETPMEASNIVEEYVDIMKYRYKLLSKLGKSSIYELTEEEMVENELFPQLLVIDELANVIADKTYGNLIEEYISTLSTQGRACGIHLVLSTQRASAKLLSPMIKANMSIKIAFKTASASNSRIAIETSGAENLVGKGDFYLRIGGDLTRGQAYYVK